MSTEDLVPVTRVAPGWHVDRGDGWHKVVTADEADWYAAKATKVVLTFDDDVAKTVDIGKGVRALDPVAWLRHVNDEIAALGREARAAHRRTAAPRDPEAPPAR